MLSQKRDRLSRNGFNLNYCIHGHKGLATFVIGSSVYYPRIFSKDLHNMLSFIFMDHRGFVFNNEAKSEDFTVDAIIDDYEALRKKLKLDKILIVGHSIHAFMALEYAKRYPQYVAGLILIATSPYPDIAAANQYFEEFASPERKAKLGINLTNLETHPTKNSDQVFVQRMLTFAPMLWYDWNFDATFLWKDVILSAIGSNIIWGSMFSDYDMKKTLNKIHCPIFLALGRHDYWNPPYLWDIYESRFKNITLRVFEKSGHTPSIEEPMLFNTEVESWLRAQGFLDIKFN